ncbi:hypothetical protein [Nitrosovibrio sp. Nv17]|uniref:hypothetical protein n=1 Tax=Nitrosovibrio sp. Nv17 TaxID=1855339 RepID=UPI000908B635|nr:hypothetical protein [Nitrosovibrio sp. Nv17]SFW35515.1 hypothetical protein SAMN05216414_12239 [Nitrosovibrio sp. Nv17]
MRIFSIAFFACALVGWQGVALAYQDIFSKREAAGNPEPQQADDPGLGLKGKKPNQEAKPWEARPWEQEGATEKSKPQRTNKTWRTSRKDRMEQKYSRDDEAAGHGGAAQHRSKWRRHQLNNERYDPWGVRQQ